MRDAANILLSSDLRQAEVVDLFKILTKEDNKENSLLVKLVKGAVEREVADATDPEGLFWVATPNVFIIINFFATVGKSFYENAISSLVNELIRQEPSEIGFPSTFAHLFLSNIVSSANFAPPEVLEVCSYMNEVISQKFPGTSKAQAVAPFIIFRGFASILTKPQAFGLASAEDITPDTKISLFEISKALISLASSGQTPGDASESDNNDQKMRAFINDKNKATVNSFLTSLVDKKVPASTPSNPSDQTISEFIKFLSKLIVRVDANGPNKNERIRTLITDLKTAVESQKKIDVDIHSSRTYSSELPDDSLNRRLSKIFLQPRTDGKVLEFSHGKLIDDIGFKCTYKDTACFFNIRKSKLSLNKLKSVIRKTFYTDEITIKYLDPEGDYLSIEKNEDLNKCVEDSRGLSVKLFLTTDLTVLPKPIATDEAGLQKTLADIERRLRQQFPGELFFRESFVISDPKLPDNPLVYVNDGFEKMTLYPSEEILGKNCRFLQGKLSDPAEVSKISRCIKENNDVSVELVNYRKDGKPFWNRFHIFPLRGEGNKVTHFVAVQQDITHVKQRARNPMLWTPTDVAEWLHFMRINSPTAVKFERGEINGKKLLEMKDADMDTIGVTDKKDKEKISQFIAYLIDSNSRKSSSSISVKAYFEEEVKVLKVKPNVSLKDFTLKVQKTLHLKNLPIIIQYENEQKEKLPFLSKTELQQKLQESKLKGQSFRVWVGIN